MFILGGFLSLKSLNQCLDVTDLWLLFWLREWSMFTVSGMVTQN